MKTFIVVNTSKGIFAPFEKLRSQSFDRALKWCLRNGYDLIEEA